MATGLLTINFWAWSLISPLATAYARSFHFTPFTLSLLVAAPVVVGSLGRIPLGLLADRYGGRLLFVLVCWLSAVAVVALRFADNPSGLLAAAFGLGVAGVSFAAGVPFINAWFPKHQRGLALGVYTLGDAGTAISGLLTPRLTHIIGPASLFWLIAALLLLAGATMLIYGREGPAWRPAKGHGRQRLQRAVTWQLTWRLSLLYAVTFGAFVALGLYLPVLLNQAYGLNPDDAAARAAGFVLLATMVRPIGGWLSDRLSGLVVVRAIFLTLTVLALVAAVNPALAPIGTVVYLGMAAVLGIGSGAIFAIIGHRCQANIVGTVSGLVGAAGGIGGYFPPLVMGLSFELFNNYSAALLLLAIISLVLYLSLHRLFGFSRSF